MIEDASTVDAVQIDESTGEVTLSLIDHLSWETSIDEQHEHMLLFQEKLNAYFRFIESGELVESFPAAAGKAVRIVVVGRYEMNDHAAGFFRQAVDVAAGGGFELRFRHFVPPDEDDASAVVH